MVSALNIIGSDRSLQEHWLRRIVAVFVDSIIAIVIGMFLTWLTLLLLKWELPFVWTLLLPNYSGVLLFLYYFVLESTGGRASVGKRIMGLRVIAMSGDVDLGKAAIRNVSKIYLPFLLLDWVVGFVSEGDPKQKWLDRVAGTTVVVTSTLSEKDQHIYQSQQSKYAPPPQEPYQAVRHEQVYQYPPSPTASAPEHASTSDSIKSSVPAPEQEIKCNSCGGRMSETGSGRLKCIRCGKIQ